MGRMIYGQPVGNDNLRYEGNCQRKPKTQCSPYPWLHSQARDKGPNVYDKQGHDPFLRNTMMAQRENHQKHEPDQAYEIGAQIHLGYEILRLVSLRTVRSRFLEIKPQLISPLRSCLLKGQAASGHFGVECQDGLFAQVPAVARDVQELVVANVCIMLPETGVQAFSS